MDHSEEYGKDVLAMLAGFAAFIVFANCVILFFPLH